MDLCAGTLFGARCSRISVSSKVEYLFNLQVAMWITRASLLFTLTTSPIRNSQGLPGVTCASVPSKQLTDSRLPEQSYPFIIK